MRTRSVGPSTGLSLGLSLAALLAGTACHDPFIPSGSTPSDQNRSVLTFEAAFAGSGHSCVLAHGGKAYCWGSNRSGGLGDGTTESSDRPRAVGGAHFYETLGVRNHTCGITTNGVALCWGLNAAGTLGDGTTTLRTLPTAADTDLRFSTITAGGSHTCAVALDGSAHCWGKNDVDQLGGHPDTVSLVPVPVQGDHRFRTVSAGSRFTCGLDDSGRPWCWGDAWGDAPRPLAGEPRWETLSVGSTHLCGLDEQGRAHCWGNNDEGELGDGTRISRGIDDPPVPAATELRFAAVSAGTDHSCAVAEGIGYCWGSDRVGQLGDGDPPGGDPAFKAVPTRVVLDGRLVNISTGAFNTCGVTDRHEAYCWGFGTGSASRPESPHPVRIGS